MLPKMRHNWPKILLLPTVPKQLVKLAHKSRTISTNWRSSLVPKRKKNPSRLIGKPSLNWPLRRLRKSSSANCILWEDSLATCLTSRVCLTSFRVILHQSKVLWIERLNRPPHNPRSLWTLSQTWPKRLSMIHLLLFNSQLKSRPKLPSARLWNLPKSTSSNKVISLRVLEIMLVASWRLCKDRELTSQKTSRTRNNQTTKREHVIWPTLSPGRVQNLSRKLMTKA